MTTDPFAWRLAGHLVFVFSLSNSMMGKILSVHEWDMFKARVQFRYSRAFSYDNAMAMVSFRTFKDLNAIYGSAKVEIVSVSFCLQNVR